MWFIEGVLEVYLGEFYIWMKGLVGYVCFCFGDYYEVFMCLGCQCWKFKGWIELDDSQIWDEEEKIFVFMLYENLDIKVMELWGLGLLVVGVVMCDIVDFFMIWLQVIVVDIIELGIIKLQLEVQWNLFDIESFLVLFSFIGKFFMGSRKGFLYNWIFLSIFSFWERYYLFVLQQLIQQVLLFGGLRVIFIFSYLFDSDFWGFSLRSQSQELFEMDFFSFEDF